MESTVVPLPESRTSSPTDPTIGDSLRFISNYNIDFVVARPQQIADAIRKYYGENEESVEDLLDEGRRGAVDGQVLLGVDRTLDSGHR